MCAAANGTKDDWNAAWDEYEKEEKNHLSENMKPSVHWRDAQTGSKSDKHRRSDTRNKSINLADDTPLCCSGKGC